MPRVKQCSKVAGVWYTHTEGPAVDMLTWICLVALRAAGSCPHLHADDCRSAHGVPACIISSYACQVPSSA